ncbi:MAG: metallophosphoesterase [Bacilli bacterium]|nr:metallophosphoesterase [Bacilli bacterium]
MHRINKTFSSLLAVFALASCAGGTDTFTYLDYQKQDLDYVEDFRVLQMTDIHFGLATNFAEEWVYFDNLISEANPDMMVLTGDMFMNASVDVVNKLYDYIDSKDIPWTVTFGNHDRQGFYTPQFIQGQKTYDKYDNCLYIDPNDNISGHGNHYVNIMSGTNVEWQVIMLDSGSYHLNDDGMTYDYDVIHEDQIAWYENVIKETNIAQYAVDDFDLLTPTQVIPSIAFFHIPLLEYVDAWEAWVASGFDEAMGSGVYEDSGVYHGYYNSGFFAKAKELGSTRGMYVGHDHTNDYTINYEGIYLSYGVKTGRGIYHNPDMIGGQVITLGDDGTVGLERIFVAYEE